MGLRRLTLAFGWVGSMSIAFQVSGQAMERPQRSEGDNWTYAFYEGANLAVSGNSYFVEWYAVNRILPPETERGAGYQMFRITTVERNGEKTKGIFRISPDLNNYARQNASSPWREAKWVQWPLEPGKRWKFEVPVAAGIQVWEAHVGAWEEVTVPAGKFKAIRVAYELVTNPDPNVGWQTTVWYSPEVRWFVKKTDFGNYAEGAPIGRQLRELKSYQLH